MKSSNIEKQQIINAALNEYGVITEELSYQECVEKLRSYLKIEDKETLTKKFGEYAIAAENYECITEDEIEEGRKVLSLLNKGKLFSKSNIYVRTFVTVKLGNKSMFSLVSPNQILWELSGVSRDMAEDIAKQISEKLGIALKIY
ncbi:MAG: hypothetical protein IJA60_06595 [Clostridia bacterium]|nr:hypothetical protein [Clostridia bacterium]